MDIKYKIIDVDRTQHSIVVRYYTDFLTEDQLSTAFNPDGSIMRREDGSPARCQTDYNINIWRTNPAPTLEEIQEIAKNSAPYDWFKLRKDILDSTIDTSLSVVDNILNQEFIAPPPTAPQQEIKTSEQEIENMIQSLLANISSNTVSTNT